MSEEYNKKQREYRKLTGNAITKKYEKSINGFLMRTYRNMKSRVTGVTKNKNHLYLGLDLVDKESFYLFSKNDDAFMSLFKDWEDSGYQRRLTPSIDRIDSAAGYTLGNMQWITFAENSIKGLRSRWSKRDESRAVFIDIPEP
jgi:hypothetical protein